MKDANVYRRAAGERLRLVRVALGFDQREFAPKTGVTEDALSAWERGVSLVRPYYVSELRRQFGVTLDYIYDGDLSGLPGRLLEKLAGPTVISSGRDHPPQDDRRPRTSGRHGKRGGVTSSGGSRR